ncbi:hypothetical protein [Tateyamaria sp.]|uniref:hypothetical protein n=1 Tax=Tateyamaria sp. TaxID=1929288 RepID=UPI00329DC011
MIWSFLSDPEHQKTLGWLGGGAMIVIGGLWQAFLVLRKKKDASKDAAKPVPTKTSKGTISAVDGDILMDNVTVNEGGHRWTPAIIAALGFATIALVTMFGGQGDCVIQGVNATGDINTDTITISGDVSDVDC